MAVFGHFWVCPTSACLLPAYPRFVPALWMTTLSDKHKRVLRLIYCLSALRRSFYDTQNSSAFLFDWFNTVNRTLCTHLTRACSARFCSSTGFDGCLSTYRTIKISAYWQLHYFLYINCNVIL
jgi:hypothetical protein